MNKREARKAAYRRAAKLLDIDAVNARGEVGCPTCDDSGDDCKDCERIRVELDDITQMLFNRGIEKDKS